MLSYLFSVTYTDGTVFQQHYEDVSSVDATRSSFFDVLYGHTGNPFTAIALFTLTGKGKSYSVDLTDGSFTINGEHITVDQGEPVTVTNRKLIFFRVTDYERTSPAVYINPKKSESLPTGELQVTSLLGEKHLYPKTAEIEQKQQVNEETGEERTVYTVWPKPDISTTRYRFGYEGTNAKTQKNYTQVITIL